MRVGVAVEWRRAGSTWRVEIMVDGAKSRVRRMADGAKVSVLPCLNN